ncbi:MAG: hypothetical protein ACTSO9_03145 [Candidatus Helarchaeota archaeon]
MASLWIEIDNFIKSMTGNPLGPESLLNIMIWTVIGVIQLFIGIFLNARVILPALFKFDEWVEIERENEGVIELVVYDSVAIGAAIIIIICASIYHAVDYLTEIVYWAIGMVLIYGLIILVCRFLVPALTPIDEVQALREEKKISSLFTGTTVVVILGVAIIYAISIIT